VTTVFYALNWAVVFILLALWSLGAWAVHGIATWTVSNAGDLAGSTPTLEGLQMPAWLALWLPPEAVLLLSSLPSQVAPFIESVLAQMPGLAGGLSMLVWIGWGIGAALLIVLGLVGSGIIAFARSGKMPWKR
jgi:hypothetical protein